jgi:TolB protein
MQRLRFIVLILLAGVWGCGKKNKVSIYTCSVDGARCEVLINSGTDDWIPAWSLDGRKIAFVREDTGGPRICVFDINTRTVNVVTDSFIDVDGISWSPNQSTIVVTGSMRNDDVRVTRGLYILDINERSATRLTDASLFVGHHAVYSLDGQKIFFSAGGRQQSTKIYSINLKSGEITILYDFGHGHSASEFSWTKDGSRIAFSALSSGNREIFVLDFASRNIRNITNHPSDDAQPSWSPDGKKIAFISDRVGVQQIFIYDLESGALKQITTDISGLKGTPSFSPDGKQIAFDIFLEQ